MKFAMMSLDFKRLPLEHCFRLASEYGFDGMEIFGARLHVYPDDLDQAAAKRVLSLKRTYGVEVPMFTPNMLNLPYCLCSRIKEERRDGVVQYKKAIDAAARIEAPRVLCVADHPGYFIDRESVWGYLVESVSELAGYAEDRGIRLVFEPLTPMESPVVTTADDLARLIRDVGNKSLYGMMDVVPPVMAHESFSQYFELLGDKMDYIHICNTDGLADAHYRLESGILPMADVINVFAHHGYTGYVTAELYSEGYRDPELFLSNTARVLSGIKAELSLCASQAASDKN